MRPISGPALLFAAAAALPPAAVGAELSFEPLLPRPGDSIVVTATYDTSCFSGPEVELDGRTVRIVALEGCICPAVLPHPLTFDVALDPLPLGIYDVELWVELRDSSVPCGRRYRVESTRLIVQSLSTHLSIRLEPPRPTSADDLLLQVDSWCLANFLGLRVVGDLIFLDEAPTAIGAPCGPLWQVELPVGRLAAGRYTLINLFFEGLAPPMVPASLGTTPTLNTVDTFEVSTPELFGDGFETGDTRAWS